MSISDSNDSIKSFAVIGNPIEHSLSPLIHQSFASQFAVTLRYEKILSESQNFQQAVHQFFENGGHGLNITTPFKSLAADLALNNCSETVRHCRSANTLFIDYNSQTLRAESTDGLGWQHDIQRLKIPIQSSNILLIGAGGVAKVLLEQLFQLNAKSVHICNRTESRVDGLLQDSVTGSGLENVPDKEWDLIINTLSIGWSGDYPEVNARVTESTLAYDLNYGHGAEAFQKWFVKSAGSHNNLYTGWGMLVEQAALSFKFWWNKMPDTQALIKSGPL